jgi:ribosomal protein S18 acetylase RimI-like enzyme
VEVVREATGEVTAAMRHLLPQLSTNAVQPDQAAVQRIVGSGATTLLAARLDGQIVGFLALAMFPIPTGFRAWIEDVIVDESARGRGIGAALTRKAIELAEAAGARTVDLTSRPSREAAGRLYERIGFAARSTRIYRYSFDRPAT